MNKRKFPRIKYECLIRVSDDRGENIIDTFTENIGAGGICVVLDRPLELFASVVLEIFIVPGKEPIRCGGAVVWVVESRAVKPREKNRYDTGIEFTGIKDPDRARISRIVTNILGR